MLRRCWHKVTLTCECGRTISHLGGCTIVGPSRFLCPHCAVGKAWPCFKCGKLTTAAGCYDDSLGFDDIPYRPLCSECHGGYEIVAPLNESARAEFAAGRVKAGDIIG